MFHERTHATRPAAAAATCMRTTSLNVHVAPAKRVALPIYAVGFSVQHGATVGADRDPRIGRLLTGPD